MASCLAGGVSGRTGHTVWMSRQVPDRVGNVEPVAKLQKNRVGGDSDRLLPFRDVDVIDGTGVMSQVALPWESEKFMTAHEVLLASGRLAQG